MKLWQYSNGSPIHRPYTLDEMFNYRIRYQILTKTQEELDYLKGMMLMYGRDIEIDVFLDWKHKQRCKRVAKRAYAKLLPIVFTTFNAGNSLRGL